MQLTVVIRQSSARRLARLRLVHDPVAAHPPISSLGFDPVLNHPSLEEFKDLIAKKKGTVKGMIMDQAFSAGVGNVSPGSSETSSRITDYEADSGSRTSQRCIQSIQVQN